MASRAITGELISVEEYLRIEEQSNIRHEYVGGLMHAMTGGSEEHNYAAGNIYTALRAAARGTVCRVFMSDIKVRTAPTVFYYPDVLVTCDPTDNDRYVKLRPCLVVEVLSPSTTTTDRREKVLAYQSLPSLRAYLVVHQDQPIVERYWRDEHGTWHLTVMQRDGLVAVPCPETALALADIYEGVELSTP